MLDVLVVFKYLVVRVDLLVWGVRLTLTPISKYVSVIQARLYD